MATNTPVFQLRKPAITDLVAVITDIGDNMDKIEAALVDLNGAHARHYNDASQSLPDAGRTRIEFPDVGVTHAGVVKGNASGGGSNNKFTIGAGTWIIETTVSFQSGTGYRSLWIGPESTDTTSWGESSQSVNATGGNLSVAICRKFTTTTDISIYLYHVNGGVALNTELAGERNHVSFTRIRG